MMPKQNVLYDLIIFQAAWFCCVLSSLSPLPGLLPIFGLVPVLLRSIYSHGLLGLFPFALTCVVMGLAGDACLVHFGLISFSEYPSLLGVPYWMLLLWLNFALMLRPLFEWFLDGKWRCLLGFSVGGAIAYYSGHRLGVLNFEAGWHSALAVAFEWAVASLVLRYLHLGFSTKPIYHDYS